MRLWYWIKIFFRKKAKPKDKERLINYAKNVYLEYKGVNVDNLPEEKFTDIMKEAMKPGDNSKFNKLKS